VAKAYIMDGNRTNPPIQNPRLKPRDKSPLGQNHLVTTSPSLAVIRSLTGFVAYRTLPAKYWISITELYIVATPSLDTYLYQCSPIKLLGGGIVGALWCRG